LSSAHAKWSGWERLGGKLISKPSCVSWGENRIDCFIRNDLAGYIRMSHIWWGGGTFWGELGYWENLGGDLGTDPKCVSWGPNRIDCFMKPVDRPLRGIDNGMYHRWWNGSRWGGWDSLGGTLNSEPSCVSWGPNRIDCFARSSGNTLIHTWSDGGSRWNAWEDLGGIVSAPNCVSWGPNRIDCFARSSLNTMAHIWFGEGGWSDWQNLGGTLTSDPDCVSWGPNRIDCFARSRSNTLIHTWSDGGSRWGAWEDLGGSLSSETRINLAGPSCVSWGLNRLDCFVRGSDNAMHHIWHSSRGWGRWESLGGILTSNPNCVSWGADRLDCFVRGTDSAMYHKWWTI